MPTPLKGDRPMTAAERSRRRWDRLMEQIAALRPIAEWVIDHADDAAIVAQARAALDGAAAQPPVTRPPATRPEPVKAAATLTPPPIGPRVPQSLARETVIPRFRSQPGPRKR